MHVHESKGVFTLYLSTSLFVSGGARNLTMEQIVELETRFNAVPIGGGQNGDYDGVEAEAIVTAAAAEPPLARRVKVLCLLGIDTKRYTPSPPQKKRYSTMLSKRGT